MSSKDTEKVTHTDHALLGKPFLSPKKHIPNAVKLVNQKYGASGKASVRYRGMNIGIEASSLFAREY